MTSRVKKRRWLGADAVPTVSRKSRAALIGALILSHSSLIRIDIPPAIVLFVTRLAPPDILHNASPEFSSVHLVGRRDV
jgi:hypothetical protein